MTITAFQNARIIDPSRAMDETGTVIVEDDKIVAAGASALNQGIPGGAAAWLAEAIVSRCSPPGSPMKTRASMRPGMMVRPVQSTTAAPPGIP